MLGNLCGRARLESDRGLGGGNQRNGHGRGGGGKSGTL